MLTILRNAWKKLRGWRRMRFTTGGALFSVGSLAIGFAAGNIPRLPINLVLLKSCQVVGVFYGAWSARRADEANVNFEELLQLFERGELNPLVGKIFPLAQYADALRCLSERQAIGKVVVNIQ